MQFEIIPLAEINPKKIKNYLIESWGSTEVVSRGTMYQVDTLPGFMAIADDRPVGLIAYHIQNQECEIVMLKATVEDTGIGSALIDAVKSLPQVKKCMRIWLITTNDNIEAIRFYQKRGFELVAVHRNAIAQSRLLKPSIPAIGKHGIPIRDEIEFELKLV